MVIKQPSYLDNLRRTYDRFAAIYDSQLIPEYPDAVEWRTIWGRLRDVGDGCTPILDAGCGTGRCSERLVRLGARVVGSDFSHESLRIARQRTGPTASFVEADARQLPFLGGVFRQAICLGVLPVILDRLDAIALLQELRRVLRRGSRLIITAFNYRLVMRVKDWLRLPDQGRQWSAYGRLGIGPNGTTVFLTQRQFRDVLSQVFSPAEIAGVWAIVNFEHKPLAVSSVLPRRLWPLLIHADVLVEHTPLAQLFGHLWLAEIVKRQSDP